ncbi:MAG TPA: TlpA disulfide reductase family protein, partial [Chloroflexota bacterium]
YLYVAPANAPPVLSNAHTSVIYLIDSKGRERVLMSGDPDSVALGRDIRILSGLPVKSGAQSIAAPEIGHPAPNFALTLLNGKTIRLSALRHHVVLLNFWATWCTACKSEMPMLAQWSHMLRDRSFLILGVDMQESASEAGPFARKLHILYPIALDNSGAVAARYDVVGLPSSFLIDANGIITSVRPGILKKDYLASDVKPLVQG